MNEGALAMMRVSIAGSGDADGDGMPDDFERANGFNPNDPSDAQTDLDNDGLTNLDEYLRGTSPVLPDTDGDGIRDGLEVQTGSDPLDPNSYNLSRALQTLSVQPSQANFVFNTASGEASKVLTVTGLLIDGTTINLTARALGTTYTSSDLSVVTFGTTDGQIFARTSGSANIVITNNTFTATVPVTVNTFEPAGISVFQLPGNAERIRVRNGIAYIAAGPAGLLVVDVHDPAHPAMVGSFDTPGNAGDVAIEGNRAYVADLTALLIFDITSPASPTLLATVPLPGEVRQVAVEGGVAWVAAHDGGLVGIDVTNPRSPAIIAAVSNASVDEVTVKDGRVFIYTYGYDSTGFRIAIFDVSRPGAPRMIGSTDVNLNVKSMVVSGNILYLAAYDQGLKALDITDPANPTELSSVGGVGVFVPADLALVGNTAIISDVYFVDSIPLVDVTQPSNLQFKAVIKMTAFGDYDGHGVDADGQYAYVVAQNFLNGSSALLIAQHNRISDDGSVDPAVSIASPSSPTLVAGRPFDVDITATDDAGVAAVSVNVDGVVYYTNNAPYRFHFRAPLSGTLTIAATVTDYAGRTAQTSRSYAVVDDTSTTVSGLVLMLEGGAPAAGVTVRSIAGTAITDATGRYTIAGVPSSLGRLEVHATVHLVDRAYSGTTTVTTVGGSTSPIIAPDLSLESLLGARGVEIDIGGYPNGMKVRDGLAYIATGAYGLQIVDVGDPRKPVLTGTAGTPGNANGIANGIALSGNLALIAAGDAGLARIDITRPYAPLLTGTLTLPAPALGVSGSETLAAVALGSGGLALVDYRANPQALLGTTALGEVRDVAFDGAVLTVLTSAELITLDVSNPAAPAVLGRVALSGYYTIEAKGGLVQAANLGAGVALIDIRTPAAPIVTSQYTVNRAQVRRVTRVGSYVFDCAYASDLAAIEFYDARYSPPQLGGFLYLNGGLAGSAIAADSDFVYEAGTIQLTEPIAHSSYNWRSRLAVVPHNLVIDDKGVPPTVTLHAPSTAINGASISITVDAADDVALRDTTLSIAGTVVATFQGNSYTVDYTVPAGVSSVAIHALATDVAGNTRSADALVSVGSDPGTTLSGIVGTVSGQRVPNAHVTAGSLQATADVNGNYNLPGVPTLDPINVTASGRLNGNVVSGTISISTFVRGGTTSADITVAPPPPGTASSVPLSGYANAIRVAGRYAFIAAGAGGLKVVDVDDPTSPIVVATLPLPGQIDDIRLAGNRAYLAAGDAGVHIVDIAAPLSPQLVTTIDTPGNALELSVNGDSVYVADGPAGVEVVNVSGTPSIVANIPTTPASAQRVSADGTRLVYISDDGSLHAVDVTQPAAPVQHGTVFIGTQQSLTLRGTLAHFAGGYYQIYSIADLDNLVPVAAVYGNYGAVIVVGSTAALTDLYSPLLVTYDISNPQAPAYRDQLDWSSAGYGRATGIDVDPAYAYITVDDNGGSGPQATGSTRLVVLRDTITIDTHGIPPSVQIMNPSNNATLVSGASTPITANATDDVAVASARLFVNGDEVANFQTAPFETTWYIPDPGSYSIYAVATDFGGNSTQSPTVTVNVIADPLTTVRGAVTRHGAPVAGASVALGVLRTISDGAGVYQFDGVPAINGDVAISVTAFSGGEALGAQASAAPVLGGLTTIDLALVPLPVGVISSTGLSQTAAAVDVSGSIAVVAMGASGLQLFDISNPLAPVAMGSLASPGIAQDVKVANGMAFVAADSAGLLVIDIAHPAAPALVATIGDASGSRSLAISGNVLYVAEGSGGLQSYDITDPLTPHLLGNFSSGHDLTHVTAFNNAVLVSELTQLPDMYGGPGSSTVHILDVTNPAAPLRVAGLVLTGTVDSLSLVSSKLFIAARQQTQEFDFANFAAQFTGHSEPYRAFGLATTGQLLVASGSDSQGDSLAEILDLSASPSVRVPALFPASPFHGDAIALSGIYAVIPADDGAGHGQLFIVKYELTDAAVARKPQTTSASASHRVTDAAVERVIDAMSPDQRLAQLMFVDFDGTAAGDELKRLVGDWHVGGVALYARNITSTTQLRKLAADIRTLGKSPAAPFVALDQEGGEVARVSEEVPLLPGNMALGATRSADLASAAGRGVADALRQLGVTMNFAPVLDRSGGATSAIGIRSFGSDPQLVGSLGAAYIRGMRDGGAAAVAKHYPGIGRTPVDSHDELPRLVGTAEDLRGDLEPFRAGIKAGVDAVMLAHAVVPAIGDDGPVMLSKRAIDTLRRDLGFEGIVITDALEMGAVDRHAGVGRIAVRAIATGADMILVLSHGHDREEVLAELHEAVRSGELTDERLRASLRRIVRLKLRLESPDFKPAPARDVARLIAEGSITLPRNRSGLLPLHEHGRATRLYVGPAGSLEHAARAAHVVHPPAYPTKDDVRLWSARVAQAAKRARVVVAVAQNRAQMEIIGAARKANPHATFVLVSLGSPHLIADLPDAAAYVCAYGYLPPSQTAAARVLSGEGAPAGRLPVDVDGFFRSGEGTVSLPWPPLNTPRTASAHSKGRSRKSLASARKDAKPAGPATLVGKASTQLSPPRDTPVAQLQKERE